MNLKTEALTQVQYYHCNYKEDEQCEERSFVCVEGEGDGEGIDGDCLRGRVNYRTHIFQ